MKINRICLNNFGSYEGITNFETKPMTERNIILIGGKNGAGKTTLFTAIRICLYGYMSMGYKNYNSFYIRAITKLINNNAKLSKPAHAEVSMQIELNSGQGVDTYTLTRSWDLADALVETFVVYKNEVQLTNDAVADFEKYIISLIPPELFNLYFFDGERIADFFLDDGSSSRIKEAFLTLCGYDTFDIMRKNFKRISGNGTASAPGLDEYIKVKDELTEARHSLSDLNLRLKDCLDNISNCEASIEAIEKDYQKKGGITEEEWNQKLSILKEEEKKRETYNNLLKKWANELIPFLMLRDKIEQLKLQIKTENNAIKYKHFLEVINLPTIQNLLGKNAKEIRDIALSQFGNRQRSILNLSLEQNALLLAQISHILSFDVDKIYKCKKAIKRSLALSSRVKKELENSSISSVQEYMKKKAQLFEEKSALLVMRVELESQIVKQKEIVEQIEGNFVKVQARIEEELKKASITDISARAILMLDKLQNVLYRKQIEKVESFFRKEISMLMRKTHFIDDIYIDDNFNIHIYRTDHLETSKIIELLKSHSEEQVIALLGKKAFEELKKLFNSSDVNVIVSALQSYDFDTVFLPLEIDRSSLSNGEKQIFIMALYHSLVSLCNNEIPFVIDTPFARIDTEHRRNIAKYFFSQLKGQVFILSTNEEINSSHIQILKDKIAATYLLENSDNKRTIIVRNSYFEV